MEIFDVSKKFPDYPGAYNDAMRFIATHFRWTDSRFKVGITSTSNLKGRARDYDRNTPYSYMSLIYRTSSERRVRDIEYDLQDHYWEICDNKRLGGGGLGTPPYYLYIVSIDYPPFLY